MVGVNELFTSFGLAGPAGLNAYLTLLVVALAGRFHYLTLNGAYGQTLTSTPIIILLVVLLTIEIFVDKIPGVDHINDLISTVIRPVAGAIVFAASNNSLTDVHPVLALVCGLIVAGGVHGTKATIRPLVTISTAGIGNSVVSTIEDTIALVVALLAIFIPILAAIVVVSFLIIALILFFWLRSRLRGRKERVRLTL